MKPDPNAPKKPQSPKVFDVMRPGKAIANPSSRPIIVGHKPQVQDTVSGVSGVGERPMQHGKRKIELSHHEEPKETTAAHAPAEPPKQPTPKPSTPVAVAVGASTAPSKSEGPAARHEPAPAPAAKPETAQEAGDSMKPIFDTSPGARQAPPPAPETKLTFDDTPAPIPDQEEIVVSHHGALDEPVKVISLLLLILVLAVVAVDILLDAGILEIDALPHTNFFE